MTIDVTGLSVDATFDLVASRIGDCTVFATFISLGDEFPADVGATLFEAAVSAA